MSESAEREYTRAEMKTATRNNYLAALRKAMYLTKKHGASDAYRHALQDLIYLEESRK
ncbi:MAG: hypothetical protein P4L10_11110 [Acidobacteriaceae bacterium]|nr:hypothetical protein [Acidobacteriaceae bacterium]